MPDPADGASQFTTQERPTEFEFVASPLSIRAFESLVESVPRVTERSNPPPAPGLPYTETVSGYVVPGWYDDGMPDIATDTD